MLHFASAPGWVFLLSLLASPLVAQPIDNFPDLLAYAEEQDPQLQNQALSVEAARLNHDAIGQWEPLELDYQGGQINAGVYDNFLTVRQNLNHFFNRRPRHELVDAQVAEAEASKEVIRNELAYRLSVAYDEWRYQLELTALQDSVLTRYLAVDDGLANDDDPERPTAIGQALLDRKIRAVRRNRALAASLAARAETEVRRLSLLPPERKLTPDFLSFPPPAVTPADSTGAYTRELRARRETLRREAILSDKLSREIDVTAGYFVQGLEQEYAFHGLALTLGVPLDRRESRVEVRQLNLEREQLGNRAQSLSQLRTRRLAALDATIADLRGALAATARDAEDDDQLIRNARRQLNDGTINVLTFRQLTETQLDDRQEYLGQLRQLYLLVRERSYLVNLQF